MTDETLCPHDDAAHEAATAHAVTSFATFNRIAKERGLCRGGCHAALMVELMEEIAEHTETPAQFLEMVVGAIYIATGLRLTNAAGVVDTDESVH